MVGTMWLILSIGLLATTAQAQQVSVVQDVSLSLANDSFRTDEYIKQNQRQYDNTVLEMESLLANFRENYRQRTGGISVQTQLLEERVQQVDEKLDPLELLNDFTKSCVLKYRGQLVSWITVKTSLNTCATTANNAVNSLIASADATKRNLYSYYNNQLKNGLNDCAKKNPALRLNYTLCVQQVISTTNTYTISSRKTFFTQLKTAQCSADNQLNTALDCSFTAQYNAILRIGEVLRLIEDCISGAHVCRPCDQDEKCAVVALNPWRNATIQDLFYHIDKDIPCARVNFYVDND